MATMGYLGQPQLDSLGVVGDAGEFLEFVRTYRHPERTWLPVEDVADPRNA
jgi:hypothetical protein